MWSSRRRLRVALRLDPSLPLHAVELALDVLYSRFPPGGTGCVQAARQLEEQHEWGEAWVDSGLVFTAENGAALDPESVSRYFRQAVKKAMLPQIRLHDLRHTHATLALQAGVHPKVVSERLGHATVSITLDTYSHAIPAMQEEAAVLIAELVFATK